MERIILPIVLLCFCYNIEAQDTLDSIARVKPVIEIDEVVMMSKLAGEDILNFRSTYSPKLEELAGQGDAAAQNLLGECYLLGKGVKQDPKKAFVWISKAAEQNNLRALHNIGYCYENGIGTDKDYFQAFSFYKLSALKGHDSSFNDVAQCYINGIGTPVDSVKARAWFEKGAEVGIRTSQTNAGYLYLTIEGKENYEKAFYWLSKAAEKNSPNALEMLGMCYDNGWGTGVNHTKAQECYLKSYQLGNEQAKDRINNNK